MISIFKDSLLYRFFAAIGRWFSGQWLGSQIIRAFVTTKDVDEVARSGIFYRPRAARVLSSIYRGLRLDRVFRRQSSGASVLVVFSGRRFGAGAADDGSSWRRSDLGGDFSPEYGGGAEEDAFGALRESIRDFICGDLCDRNLYFFCDIFRQSLCGTAHYRFHPFCLPRRKRGADEETAEYSGDGHGGDGSSSYPCMDFISIFRCGGLLCLDGR